MDAPTPAGTASGARSPWPESAGDGPLRSELAGMIEHELLTAHTVARGYLRMLLAGSAGPLSAEQQTWAREGLRALARGEVLLRNLAALVRTGREPGRSAHKPLRAHELLEAAVASARPLLELRGLRVELHCDADRDALRGDAEALEQVFVNLLANCARYAPADTRVQVHTSALELGEREFLCAAVRDEGPGVRAADAARIFEAFARGSQGVDGQGMGLGLAICRRHLAAHDGSIEAVPDLGYGLFRVLLPLDRES
jgi:two-component system sensor histidine kinase KdpD